MTQSGLTIHCLIPARSGSKGIPHKCIVPYLGRPLMTHSIEVALSSPLISRTVVSTDSSVYASLAREAGAEVPFLRPVEIAGDLSTDLECFQHYLGGLSLGELPDVLVHLRPTYPNRTPELLADCLRVFLDNYDRIDSLRTVCPVDKSPMKMYTLDDGLLSPLFPTWRGLEEPYNRCRQELPQCYIHNGCIDIVKTEVVLGGSMSGSRIFPYVMEEIYDIDSRDDLARSESSIVPP